MERDDRQVVADLVQTHQSGEALAFEGFNAPLARVPAAPDHAGTSSRAGAWEIVRELRRGRMGPLYLVERADTRSSDEKGVLTWIRSSATPETIARRLRHEWHALAALKHGSIASFLDHGQAKDGRAFVVMEHIAGRPIHRYCDEELLTLEERLDLFLKVCAAVQYAHRQLIVHGGLEPSNVVVTAGGDVKLLDFGLPGLLARTAAEPDDLQEPRVWIPAPAYASPEQVRGEPVAVASDVYQLGLLLYELLTGEQAQTPGHASAAALEEAISATSPVRPSDRAASAPEKVAAARRLRPRAFVRRLRGDLDAILLYALRKEPDRRYPSVSLLRSDVQRYRRRLPVWAESGTVIYRLRKLVLRRRAALAAGAVVLFIGAAALPAPVRQRLRAARETARIAQVEQVLGGLLAIPDAGLTVQPPSALQFVEQGERLARTELVSEPRSQARLLTTIGRAYSALGYDDRSVGVLEEALMLRRANFGDDSLEVGDTLEALGRGLHHLGRYDEAESSLRTAVAIRQLRGDDSRRIRATIELGDLLHTRGQLLQAEQELRGAEIILRPEVLKAGDDAPVNELLTRALHELANVLRDRGALPEAAALYQETIATLRQYGAQPSSLLAEAQVDLARMHVMRSELGRAEAALAGGVPALRRIHHADHPLVARSLREQGYLRIEQGRLDEAGGLLAEALRVYEQTLGRIHPELTSTRALQAELARRRGQLPQAVTLARQTLAEFERLVLHDHPDTIELRATLAEALIALGQRAEAVRALGPAIADAERLFVSSDPRITRLRQAMARAVSGRPGG